MHTLDNDPVDIGDTVYGVGHGPGEVVEMRSEGRFRVEFASGRTITFDSFGNAARSNHRSLYWRNPVLVPPMKDETRWNRLTPVIRALVDAFELVA